MAAVALALYVLYLALAFGLRTLIQLRRTGSTGFHGLGGRPLSAEWIAGVGFTLALLVGAAAPVLALLDVVEPISTLDTTAAHVLGLVLAVGGIAATFRAQIASAAMLPTALCSSRGSPCSAWPVSSPPLSYRFAWSRSPTC